MNLRSSGESETVIKSAKKNLKRKLEREFARMNFVHSGKQCFLYPETLEISEVVKQLLAAKEDLEDLKALSGDEKLVTKCALFIKDVVKKTSVSLPSPPTSSDLKSENFHCPKLLDLFYTVLLNGGIKSSINKSKHLKQSFSQDLVYTITNGEIKTPKSILFPYHIKSLTNNTEHFLPFRTWNFIFLNRRIIGRNSIPYHKLEAVEERSVSLPVACIMSRFTIEADDNTDPL